MHIMNFNLKRFQPAGTVIGALACGALLSAAWMQFASAEVNTAIGNDVSANELRAITVESWDYDRSTGGYGWEVVTDKDNPLKESAPYKPLDFSDQAEREAKLIPGTPTDIKDNINFKDARVQGARFVFTFPGYNVVTIRPPWVDHYKIERPRPYLYDIANT
ncbi:MAG: endoflagellar filament sheath protein, partial [Leptospiraceae bacterium]|nr:endoflagellar filament sheath protein [Leptospiraceae bacterium]